MKILVTGGAGFIGRWVVGVLLDLSHQVAVVDDLSRGSEENLEEYCFRDGFVGLHIADVTDHREVADCFFWDPDVCIHLASVVDVQRSLDSPREAFEVDLRGTLNVLEQCKQRNTRMVYVSTCMVYAAARDGKPISEEHPAIPLSPYAGVKLAAEKLVESYSRAYSISSTILRPFNVYGPFQGLGAEGGVVAKFVDHALRREALPVCGTGRQTRDFLYVEDCSGFIAAAALSERVSGMVLNAGTGRETSIGRLAEIVSVGKIPIEHVRHPHPNCEIDRMICDYSRARELLDWRPGVSLEDGVARTLAWAKATLNATKRTRKTNLAGSAPLVH